MPRSRSRTRSRTRSPQRRRYSRSPSHDRDRRHGRRDENRYKRKEERPRDRTRTRSRSIDRYRNRDRHGKRDDYDRDRRRHKRSRSYDRDKRRDRSRSRHNETSHRKNDERKVRSSRERDVSNDSTEINNKKPSKISNDTDTKSLNGDDSRQSSISSKDDYRQSFESFSSENKIVMTNIESEEDRIAIQEKMQEHLKRHFAAQGKVYPPPKPEKPLINAATGFANDGSFLDYFKKMQQEYKEKTEQDKKRAEYAERLKNLPVRRRGGKILKTGIVAKKVNEETQEAPVDAWTLYLKEVQKYKNASCDADSKTRPLVK